MARALAGAAILLAASGSPSASQSFSSASYAECIAGSGIGCQQVDFFFTLLGAGASATADAFTISLLGDGWFFSALQGGEAEDWYGDSFFVGDVSTDGRTLIGTFVPGFEVLLDPTLRIRSQFDHEPDAFGSTASLSYSYSLSSGSELLAAGEIAAAEEFVAADQLVAADRFAAAGQVVPEPVSMALLGTGLAGVAIARSRRRRSAPDETA